MYIMCRILLVQRFKPQGRRFTNFHYYYYYYFMKWRKAIGNTRNA